MCPAGDKTPHHGMLLVNLVQINLKLGRHVMAEQVLKELADLPIEKKDLKIYIDYGYFLYYSAVMDTENSLKCLHAMVEFNDHYGHPAGDQLIRMVAACLKENATENMAVFRYGGDEFVCLHWGAQPETLKSYVRRVQTSMEEK